MKFFKIKHIAVKSDGAILFDIGKDGEVFRHTDGEFYLASNGDHMTPLYDSMTDELVGFCESVITFEE